MGDLENDRVTILTIGISAYKYLSPLKGPTEDLKRIKELFIGSKTGLYEESRFFALENAQYEEIRKWLVDFAKTRTATGDVLVTYFSGHGCVLGTNEFAFCPTDAVLRADGGDVLALSVLRFGDVVETLAAADVYPVFIIDACGSGATGRVTEIAPQRVMASMQDELHRRSGSSYAILCSCSSRHVSSEYIDGGIVTSHLLDIVGKGLSKYQRKECLTLQDIFSTLQRACEQTPDIPAPELYLGPSLPPFAICRNAAFKELTYSFQRHFADLILYMFKCGNPYEVSMDDIRTFGSSAYGDHNKLSFAPWRLLEDGSSPRHRRLTERGIQFAQGHLYIPRIIRPINENTKEPTEWEADNASDNVSIHDVKR